MTDEDRRVLTEDVLGEKWHYCPDRCYAGIWKHWWQCSCGYRFKDADEAVGHVNHSNRTFTCWQDTGDLKCRLVDMGEWAQFFEYTIRVYREEIKSGVFYFEHFNWLMDEIRFPELVVEWWKERGKG